MRACSQRLLIENNAHLITGGTDNHMMVVDTVSSFNLTGNIAENVLDEAGITLNKQMVPDEPLSPMKPSGIRLGTPAATARGMGEPEMKQMASIMLRAMRAPENKAELAKLREETKALCNGFPVPGVNTDKPARSAAA